MCEFQSFIPRHIASFSKGGNGAGDEAVSFIFANYVSQVVVAPHKFKCMNQITQIFQEAHMVDLHNFFTCILLSLYGSANMTCK